MENDKVNILLAGPAILLLSVAALAAFLLLLFAAGQLPKLTMLVAQASVRRMRGRILLVAWGILAELLLIALAAGIGQIKVLGLLALVVLWLAFALAGLGICIAARRAGRALLAALGEAEDDAVCSLLIGLLVLSLAALIPVIGWAVTLAAAATGVGIVWETLFRWGKWPATPS